MADHFWSYDINDGLQWHDTAAAAENAADELLTIYRSEADSDGEWHDGVTSICWGEARGHVVETTGTTEEYGEEREWVDYHLAPVEETSERAESGAPTGGLAAALDEAERLRAALRLCFDALDSVMGDTDLDGDDSIEFRAMQAATKALRLGVPRG